MRVPVKARHLPARLIVGAFVLNSGLTKRPVDQETAEGLHGMAAGAYPFLKQVDPVVFTRLLSAGEITLGAALLAPVVPTGVAGAGLTGFSGGLVGLYLRTPGMHERGSPRPTQQGLSLAKDAWLVGIGLSFVVDALVSRCGRRR
ncbi:hypothetical protein FHX42_003553 [Saccharopolyspora lacisalsi]|uniref:DoxX family membrane protein n=1 Tax=Halosaccharopolyspora lacisalsi TaxID=1000566 RepID=A0A839E355_9PSEU|nr:hypothetical protein [Halosaccharopolyspora lacisalsi]MBA8826177.1 hypothetical protein [Halosaccharopolyspora lacisalsi]